MTTNQIIAQQQEEAREKSYTPWDHRYDKEGTQAVVNVEDINQIIAESVEAGAEEMRIKNKKTIEYYQLRARAEENRRIIQIVKKKTAFMMPDTEARFLEQIALNKPE